MQYKVKAVDVIGHFVVATRSGCRKYRPQLLYIPSDDENLCPRRLAVSARGVGPKKPDAPVIAIFIIAFLVLDGAIGYVVTDLLNGCLTLRGNLRGLHI